MNNNLFNLFGGFQNFQAQFKNFAQNFNQQNQMSPQERVQQLLNSGQMTQEQFEQLRAMANQITGKNI